MRKDEVGGIYNARVRDEKFIERHPWEIHV